MNIQEVLKQVQEGTLSAEQAEAMLREEHFAGKTAAKKTLMENDFAEMGYAKLDTDRKRRTGFAEVVFCSGKSVEQLVSIYRRIYDTEGEVLGTRASKEQYEEVRRIFPAVSYDAASRILKIEKPDKERIGKIAVCTAGTADIPVAEEAAQTAEFFGTRVERVYDVGVSGLHRLLSRLDTIRTANCVITAAGMEGALASVDRRAGERSGDRGSDIGGIRSEFRRSVRITDDDQFLCKRRGNRQHRQWLRRRVSGGTDQPISLPPIAQGCGRIKPHFTADFQA